MNLMSTKTIPRPYGSPCIPKWDRQNELMKCAAAVPVAGSDFTHEDYTSSSVLFWVAISSLWMEPVNWEDESGEKNPSRWLQKVEEIPPKKQKEERNSEDSTSIFNLICNRPAMLTRAWSIIGGGSVKYNEEITVQQIQETNGELRRFEVIFSLYRNISKTYRS